MKVATDKLNNKYISLYFLYFTVKFSIFLPNNAFAKLRNWTFKQFDSF